jgi:hypothetical protein
MYAGDAYQLVDGQQVTMLINPVRGVKQECLLSPLLFALFISDNGRLTDAPDAQGQPLGVPLRQAQEGEPEP